MRPGPAPGVPARHPLGQRRDEIAERRARGIQQRMGWASPASRGKARTPMAPTGGARHRADEFRRRRSAKIAPLDVARESCVGPSAITTLGLQAEVIAEVLAGRSAMAVLPTGGGKSLCYQIPALHPARPGPGRLAADRADAGPGHGAAHRAWRRRGWTRNIEPAERRDLAARIDAGDLDLLYVSPEGPMQPGMWTPEPRALALLAVDEAHASASGATTSGPSTACWAGSPRCSQACRAWR